MSYRGMGMPRMHWLRAYGLTFANPLHIDLNVVHLCSHFGPMTQTVLTKPPAHPIDLALYLGSMSRIVVGCCFRGSRFFRKLPRTLMCGFGFRRRGPHWKGRINRITSQLVAHEGILSNNGRACGCVDVWSPHPSKQGGEGLWVAYFQQNRKQNKVKHVTEWSSLKGMRGRLSGRMWSREIGNEECDQHWFWTVMWLIFAPHDNWLDKACVILLLAAQDL